MRRVGSNWQGVLLVCGKCTKKVGGGFGAKGKTGLAKGLRRELGLGKGRRARIGIVETKCLGVCPKRAVTVIDPREPDAWWLVTPGTPIEEIVQTLNLLPPVEPVDAVEPLGEPLGGGLDEPDHVGDALGPV